MLSINEFTIVGKLLKAMPGQTNSGTNFTRLFVESERLSANGTVTDHFEIGCWSTSTKDAAEKLAEGATVAIVGRIASNTYTDKNGARRLSYNLVADRISGDNPAPTPVAEPDFITEDDLPF